MVIDRQGGARGGRCKKSDRKCLGERSSLYTRSKIQTSALSIWFVTDQAPYRTALWLRGCFLLSARCGFVPACEARANLPARGVQVSPWLEGSTRKGRPVRVWRRSRTGRIAFCVHGCESRGAAGRVYAYRNLQASLYCRAIVNFLQEQCHASAGKRP